MHPAASQMRFSVSFRDAVGVGDVIRVRVGDRVSVEVSIGVRVVVVVCV